MTESHWPIDAPTIELIATDAAINAPPHPEINAVCLPLLKYVYAPLVSVTVYILVWLLSRYGE
jgi:hypothetical protein